MVTIIDVIRDFLLAVGLPSLPQFSFTSPNVPVGTCCEAGACYRLHLTAVKGFASLAFLTHNVLSSPTAVRQGVPFFFSS